MPVPGYSPRPCSRWKMTKIRSAYCGSMPIPLSRTANNQSSPCRSAATWTRGGSAAVELDGVADQVLEELHELRLVGHHRGQLGDRDRGIALLDGGLEVGQRPRRHFRGVRGPQGFALGADPRIGQQVIDQALHRVRRPPRNG